jgi:hypothetical protein
MNAHFPAPWSVKVDDHERMSLVFGDGEVTIATILGAGDMAVAHALLLAAAPDMIAALRLHKAWHDSERAGPDYGGQSRATHPDGELIWRRWWNNQLDLCARSQDATNAAIAKAEGRA